jgi:hypothetical protein
LRSSRSSSRWWFSWRSGCQSASSRERSWAARVPIRLTTGF